MSTQKIPDTIKIIAIEESGENGRLVTQNGPCPRPGPGEVLVKIAAAGINRPDLMQVAGMYPPPPGASDIPGLELAGQIVACGDDCGEWQPGMDMCALVTGGAYAQYAVVPAQQCLPVPKGLSLTEAACLPETFFTVWHNVFDKAQLQAGEVFLVHGGTSGIGTTAIQMAKAMGATVIATAGSDEKCEACRKLGADHAINYRDQDFVAAVMEATEGKGANVILDMVAGDYIDRDFKCAAQDGRIAVIAFLRGPKAETNFLPLLRKRLTLTGSTLRAQPVAAKGAIADKLRKTIWPLIEEGRIKPVIYREVAFDDAQQGHDILKDGAHIGKVVIKMG
ncbi:NAD(P)H-quinone oxidoreductase [Thalassospira sp. MCCC 1A01428]|uniref:NAD(P)H-quinone oxidoreductase n=1 Tax=Thalassospira sp. MCCC 1A01428 TaxID=1470575 RepID=UPI000A1FDCC6|nr:NAD(P)H-quinone oxidoreductase [Thalassospira sp. MCCC 1A01428]OSQ36203.1 NAD(P)H-quinone oxidoreductase [Thalassospira sp. MCCC 1A01428]